jgi:hypothetical protein
LSCAHQFNDKLWMDCNEGPRKNRST